MAYYNAYNKAGRMVGLTSSGENDQIKATKDMIA